MQMKRLIGLAAAAAAMALLGGCMTDPMSGPKKAAFVGSEKCGTCHEVVAEEESDSAILQKLGLQEAPPAPPAAAEVPAEPVAGT